MAEPLYVRFQAAVPNRRGLYPGVFVLVNGLWFDGKLSAEEGRFRRSMNDWYNASFTNPAWIHPHLYDCLSDLCHTAWFKASAHELIASVAGYLRILDRHRIPWQARWSPDPGCIVYEDADQIVVIRHALPSSGVTCERAQ